MANVYVRSGAVGTGTGADWTNAFTTLAAALTAKAAGDSFFVSEDHAETQASAMTLTSPGTNATPCFIYCVNHAGSVPPVSADLRTTATISTTGNSAITIAGSAYCYGIAFAAGTGANSVSANLCNGNSNAWKFDACALNLGGTSGGNIVVGSNNVGNYVEWNNTTVQFAATGSQLKIDGYWLWRNTPSAITGATLPTTLMAPANGVPGLALVEGVDLSALGSGKTLVGTANAAVPFILKDCKLGASVTIAATPGAFGANIVDLIRGDSAATNYRHERYRYSGTETVETTIVRTGGASDGTTTIAKKIVTTANSKWVLPFEAIPIAIWNDTSGSAVTLTLYGIWGGGAVPNNDDIWIDVEYLGASGNPQGSFISASKADNLATGSALTSDSSTWGGSTTAFKMAVTFTPQQKGAVYVYVKAAKASSTFYIDPKPVLS